MPAPTGATRVTCRSSRRAAQAAATPTASGALIVTRSGGTPETETAFSMGLTGAGDRVGGSGGLGQLGEGQLVADLTHQFGHPYVQRVANGGEQFGGRLLLPPLHLGEIAE